MTKDEIIKGALEVAETSKHKGTILATVDGNVFLQKNKKDINGCVLHVRSTGKEQSIYVIDNSESKPSCKTISLKELISEAYIDNADKNAIKATEDSDKAAAAKAKEEAERAKKEADEAAAAAAGNSNPEGADQTDKLKILEVKYSEMTNAELKDICADLGIDTGKAKKKQDFIDLLLAFEIKGNK